MNMWTKQIAKLLKISDAEALEIQNLIDERNWLDWSECTNRQLGTVARWAQATLEARK